MKSGENHSDERGFGNFRALLGIAIFVGIIYLAYKLLPPYINNYQFQSEIEAVARYSAYAQNKSSADIKQDVLTKAKECDVMLGPDNIEVEKTGNSVNIDVKYIVLIPLPGKTVEMSFHPTAGTKQITAR